MTHKSGARLIESVTTFRESGLALVLALLIVGLTVAAPRFLLPSNLRNVLVDISILLIVAVAETMIIITRNIDISVGSILGFSGLSAGILWRSNLNVSVGLGVLVACLIGLGIGLTNGVIVAWLRVPSVILTLGMLSLLRGLMFVTSGGKQVDPQVIPESVIALAQTSPVQIPAMVLIAAAIAGVAAVFLSWTPTGRSLYALGSNPTAARLRGLPINRLTILVFGIGGLLAGLCGVLYAGRYGTINPINAGAGLEFQVLAAAVIGGTNINGGRGTVAGTFLGCLLLGVIANGLAIGNVPPFWQAALSGAIIVVAVVTDTVVTRRLQAAATLTRQSSIAAGTTP